MQYFLKTLRLICKDTRKASKIKWLWNNSKEDYEKSVLNQEGYTNKEVGAMRKTSKFLFATAMAVTVLALANPSPTVMAKSKGKKSKVDT